MISTGIGHTPPSPYCADPLNMSNFDFIFTNINIVSTNHHSPTTLPALSRRILIASLLLNPPPPCQLLPSIPHHLTSSYLTDSHMGGICSTIKYHEDYYYLNWCNQNVNWLKDLHRSGIRTTGAYHDDCRLCMNDIKIRWRELVRW